MFRLYGNDDTGINGCTIKGILHHVPPAIMKNLCFLVSSKEPPKFSCPLEQARDARTYPNPDLHRVFLIAFYRSVAF